MHMHLRCYRIAAMTIQQSVSCSVVRQLLNQMFLSNLQPLQILRSCLCLSADFVCSGVVDVKMRPLLQQGVSADSLQAGPVQQIRAAAEH